MFDPASVKKIEQLTGHRAAIYDLCAGRTAETFRSAAGDGWLVDWPRDGSGNGQLIARTESQLFSLAPLPDEQGLVAGDMHGGLHWLWPGAPERSRDLAHHRKGVYALLTHGDWLFSAGGEGMLTRWDARAARSVESLQLSNHALRCLDYSAERNELAVGSSDNHIYLLDADSLRIRHQLLAHDNSVFCIRYHPSGRYLLSGGRDAQLRIWELMEVGPLQVDQQAAHWFTINDIAFRPDGRLFATASRDKTIKLWDAEQWTLLKVLDTIRDGGHINSVNRLLWVNDQELVSASDDRSLIRWGVVHGS